MVKDGIISEDDSNMLYVMLRKVHLKLASEVKARMLGILNEDGTRLYIVRNRKKHEYLTTHSYGFNYQLLTSLPDLKTLRIKDEKGLWEVDVYDVLEWGHFLHFKSSKDGNVYEKQIFYPLDKLRNIGEA